MKAGAGAAILREIDDLPGPRSWPFFGSLLQVDPPRIHQNVEAWARSYGPFFRLRLGRYTLLVVADHEAYAAALRDRPEGFRRIPKLARISDEMGIQPGVFNAEGDDWRRQRRVVMAGFDPRRLKAYFPSLVKVTRRLEARWRRAAATGAPIDLQGDLMRFTVDAISGLAFGNDFNTLESDDDIIQRHLDKIFPAFAHRLIAPVATWRYWKSRADRELERSVAAVNEAIAGFIAAARERLAADPARRENPPNLLEAMIVAADADAEAAWTDRDIAGNVMTMLLAGEDTTANTLAWMIYLLDRHPDQKARAVEEAARLGPVDAWTYERVAAPGYLDACANETMRLKPVAPTLLMQALRDTVIGDVRVPARSVVWGAMRSDNLNERYFPEPQRFDPGRWLGGDPARAASAPSRVSMPFGAGPRVCPGRQLAMLEIKSAMAMLLNTFEIVGVDTPGGGEAVEHLAFTMAPVGLTMRLRVRG
ncbi:cytochrome P450 [Piscinibacter koreensis]|uniref:Cytochrome P450 n=1 Tax=Piscinibacter koreensis TaxID=2742824 RepID=A0A7Y6NKM3_9BURK|nr:cytochrome P450 [Schlegelella koreensis]NUZ04958.1 cytochrome P450 [Schlegelella koreensis]